MKDKLKLAVVGLVHDHVWDELQNWVDTGRVEIVAAADLNDALRERVVKEFHVDNSHKTAGELFDQCDVDVVQICTSNAEGVEVVEQAAARGIHAVVEKPLAATLAGARRMVSAAETAGTMLFVNWPFRWQPNVPAAWRLIQDGIIGHVFNARIRMAHKGPREFGCSNEFCGWLYDASQNGGGAIVDYCCYGAVALRHLFGMPDEVQAVAGRYTKTDIAVDDNAAITLIYEKRKTTAEASWSQIPSYHDSIFHGTKGTLWTSEGKIFVATEENEQREISVEPLPEDEQTGPALFLKCLEQGIAPPDVCAADVCRDAQEILQAGIESNATGRRLSIPLSEAN